MSEYVDRIQKILKAQPFGSRPFKLLSKLCSDEIAAREESSAQVLLAAGSSTLMFVLTSENIYFAQALHGRTYGYSRPSSALTSAHARGNLLLVLGSGLIFGPVSLGNGLHVNNVASYLNEFHQQSVVDDRAAPLGAVPITAVKVSYGVTTTPDGQANLVAYSDRLEVQASPGIEPTQVLYADVDELSISGQGVVRTGGGFIGGGELGQAAAVGMLTATALNAATTKQHIDCKIDLKFAGGQLMGYTGLLQPQECEAILAPAFTILRRRPERAGSGGLASELDQLARLRAEGHLTDAEFSSAKNRLLGS